MGDMLDATNPANIPADRNGSPAAKITVLANVHGQMFDVEGGNAPAAQVAGAVADRTKASAWSAVYCGWSNWDATNAAIRGAGETWRDASEWPAPGPYIWAADPSGNLHTGAWKLPVQPVAVQVSDNGTTDTSVTYGRFPARVAGYIDGPVSRWPDAAWQRFSAIADAPNLPVPDPTPEPTPAPDPNQPPVYGPPTGDVKVQLPLLEQGIEHPSVGVVQRLVGGLAVDDMFGPATKAGVEGFQHAHGLTVDGIVGAHTWGALLGAPQ